MNKESLSKTTKIDTEVFICCASFEQRCLSIAQKVDTSVIKRAIICTFDDSCPYVENNLKSLCELFRENGKVITLKKDSPLENYDKLYDILQSLKGYKTIIDISTFTREMFLICFQLFKQLDFNREQISICYNPSSVYSNITNLDDFDKIWLSKGVNEIRSILGFSGSPSTIKRNLLIVLAGFEMERAQILIDSFEPAVLYLGKAPAKFSNSVELSKINDANVSRLLAVYPNAFPFEFSCVDLGLTIDQITKIIEQNQEQYNIIISPMNNKVSTLAVASIAFKYPDIQICYASANMYNISEYSRPSDNVLWFNAQEIIQ